MSSSRTTNNRNKTIIDVKKMSLDRGDITYISIELIKHNKILNLILRKNQNGNFWMIAEKQKNRGSVSIHVSNFPQFKDEDYINRSIIRWIFNNANLLFNKFRRL